MKKISKPLLCFYTALLSQTSYAHENIPYSVLASGDSSANGYERSFTVFRDRNRFFKEYKKYQLVDGYRENPDIDFTKESVAIISMGQQPSLGSRVSVESAKLYSQKVVSGQSILKNKVELTVKYTEHGINCGGFAQLSNPVVIVKINTTDTVTIKEIDAIQDCSRR